MEQVTKYEPVTKFEAYGAIIHWGGGEMVNK
jgi:hypothetical protein